MSGCLTTIIDSPYPCVPLHTWWPPIYGKHTEWIISGRSGQWHAKSCLADESLYTMIQLEIPNLKNMLYSYVFCVCYVYFIAGVIGPDRVLFNFNSNGMLGFSLYFVKYVILLVNIVKFTLILHSNVINLCPSANKKSIFTLI